MMTGSPHRTSSKPRLTDVASRAHVSLGTASNVLNRPEIVAPAARQRVYQAIADLGYVRNQSARELRLGPDLVPTTTDPAAVSIDDRHLQLRCTTCGRITTITTSAMIVLADLLHHQFQFDADPAVQLVVPGICIDCAKGNDLDV